MTDLGLTFVDAKNAVFSYDNDKRRIGYSRENEAVAQENGEIIWSLVLYLVPLPLNRVRFKNEQSGIYIDIHRPHPGSIMKEWMIKAIYQHLKSNNLI